MKTASEIFRWIWNGRDIVWGIDVFVHDCGDSTCPHTGEAPLRFGQTRVETEELARWSLSPKNVWRKIRGKI